MCVIKFISSREFSFIWYAHRFAFGNIKLNWPVFTPLQNRIEIMLQFLWVGVAGYNTVNVKIIRNKFDCRKKYKPASHSYKAKKKSKGPKTDPWGTPEKTDARAELASLLGANWERLVKNDTIQLNTLESMLSLLSFSNRSLCDTLSKAFDKSKKMRSTWDPWTRAVWKLLVIERSCVLQEKYFLTPYWNGKNSKFVSTKITSCA